VSVVCAGRAYPQAASRGSSTPFRIDRVRRDVPDLHVGQRHGHLAGGPDYGRAPGSVLEGVIGLPNLTPLSGQALVTKQNGGGGGVSN
jgi:hypothetical protein